MTFTSAQFKLHCTSNNVFASGSFSGSFFGVESGAIVHGYDDTTDLSDFLAEHLNKTQDLTCILKYVEGQQC